MYEDNNTELQPESTQPQAVNVEEIISNAEQKAIAAAEKKSRAVFKSMLEQNGYDDEAVNAMTAEWKAKQKPDEPVKPQDSEEYKALLNRMEALEQSNTKAQAKLTERQQFDYLKGKGIPEGYIEFYHFKASKLVKDDVSFEQAAEAYIKDNPVQVPPPQYKTGAGKAIDSGITLDEYKKLTYDERLALKQEKPTVFEYFAKLTRQRKD